MDIQDLKTLIASRLDVEEFLDLIGWTMFDLVDALEEVIDENFEELLEACNGWKEEILWGTSARDTQQEP